MTKLKVGLVGCGFIAQKRHIPSFIRLRKKVSIQAVCDLDYRLARRVSRNFGISQAYHQLSDMLSKEDLDIVDICTPPGVHARLAIESMKEGCHVLMEKPMALEVSDCDQMIKTRDRCGVKLSVVHNQRFYPAFLKGQQLFESGIIGRLSGMRILSMTHSEDYMIHENHWVHKLPGGVLEENAPHCVYMSLAFMKRVKNVSVCAKKVLKYPWILYDDYRIGLEGEKVNSSILISHANNCEAEEVDLLGVDGIIRMDLHTMLVSIQKRQSLKPASLALSSLNAAGQIVRGVAANTSKVILGRTFLGHEIMIEKFVNSIKEDSVVPVPPEEGRETTRIVELIVKKMRAQQAQKSTTLIRDQI